VNIVLITIRFPRKYILIFSSSHLLYLAVDFMREIFSRKHRFVNFFITMLVYIHPISNSLINPPTTLSKKY
jgi:hypothetical protein